MRARGLPFLLLVFTLALQAIAQPRFPGPRPTEDDAPAAAPCNPHALRGLLWWGTRRFMSVDELARYAGPILWFSPDEPSLGGADGDEIRHPEAFPFEPQGNRPVLYYQLTDVFARGEEADPFVRSPKYPGASLIDLRAVLALRLSYYAYFRTEEGLGAHPHDIEPAEFRLVVLRTEDVADRVGACAPDLLFLIATRVAAKAHGLVWFWNVLETDEQTFFPMHLLVEEGKHALATDKNGDGAFTPGYDVNIRINDAWGTRDIIRTGMLFTGGYQDWMTKRRRPEHRVLPPLPADSPLVAGLRRKTEDTKLAVYEVRPFPASARARDPKLRALMLTHERPGWPEIGRLNDADELGRFMREGGALKSLSISFYADGDVGFSLVFPLLIVAHVNDPMMGGYFLHRVILKDDDLRDFSWLVLYTPSASRWIDTYVAAGYEKDVADVGPGLTETHRDFVFETGLKFRANISKTPIRFLTFFTDYWGVRFGIKNRGFWTIDRLTYVFELGAGSF